MTRRQCLLIVFLVSILLVAAPIQAQGAEAGPPDRHQDDVLRTFFLENAEVKDVMTMLRALVGAKHVAADEEVHAILVRDTPAKVELAAEIVRTQDQPRDEVVIHLELIDLPTIPDVGPADHVPGRLSRDQLARLRSTPGARAQARSTLSAVAGKKAELLIGDRVPIDTGAGVVYQEVGLKVVIRPRVHAGAAEVTLDFQVERSYRAADGVPGRPVIETRQIVSSARLGDGESYLLTGLSDAARGAAAESEREIALVLTPHIVRRVEAG